MSKKKKASMTMMTFLKRSQVWGEFLKQNQEEDDEEVKDPKEEAKDDADEPMDDEQAKSEEPEEDEDDEMDIGKFEEEEVRDAMEYPRWMERVQFGSRTLPAHPCMIGDAQPDFVNLILLQMGSNINHIIKNFHRNFCGPVGNLWKHFQSHNDLRADLDPKIPYIGLDDNGDLIEPDEITLGISTKLSGGLILQTIWVRTDSSDLIKGHSSSNAWSSMSWNVDLPLMTSAKDFRQKDVGSILKTPRKRRKRRQDWR